MTKNLLILLIILLYLNIKCEKIIEVFELSRHGARAPMYVNLDARDWNEKLEVLYNVVMRQMSNSRTVL